MITPLDIQNKEFSRSFRGYKEPDVDKFLDEIVESYENLYKENIELKDKIVALTEQVRQYSTLEKTLKDTLIVAQATADEVTTSARNKGQLIIEEAEMAAKKHISAANEEVKNIRKEYEHLKKEMFVFKTRYKSFIEAQLITLDEFYSNIESEGISNSSDYSEQLEEIDSEEDIENLGA